MITATFCGVMRTERETGGNGRIPSIAHLSMDERGRKQKKIDYADQKREEEEEGGKRMNLTE